jgi:class 3 adenylate cyclase
MNEEQAQKAYTDYCLQKGREVQAKGVERMKGGSWLFVEVDEPPGGRRYQGVVVRENGRVFTLFGAIGKVFRQAKNELGAPKSCERFLGSTALGCYQAFDAGFAIWEGGEDIGFPLIESLIPFSRQVCIVAFFDLRGFTSWSKESTPENVQQAIQAFESSIHKGFPYGSEPWERLFLKGTGDGVMIVSQADWHNGAQLHHKMIKPARGHAKKFLHACELAVSAGRKRLSQYNFPLAIGCGIASGELDRVFLFGRFDFIGPAANEAAKLQQHAWNEICVTPGFGELIKLDGLNLDAEWVLPTKGWRLRSPEIRPSK